MTEVKDGQLIRAGGCRVAAIFNGVLDLGGGEGVSVVVERVLPADSFECSAHSSGGSEGNGSGELVAELSGDDLGFGVDLVVEMDGLVWILVGAFP